jgi:hemoglobin
MTFYDKALDSDQIGGFFEDIEMKRLVDHQTKFIASLLGGPASFPSERLQHIHAKFDISDQDLDEMAKLLAEALDEHNFEASDRDEILVDIEAHRTYIVSRSTK